MWRKLLLAALLAGPAAAPWAAGFDPEAALEASQAAIGRTVGDHVLVGSDGRQVRLSDLAGTPLLISFVYTACYEICPTTTKRLLAATREARAALGDGRFLVLVVGFDTEQDTPEAMRVFARKLGAASEPGWLFLSGDRATIERLAAETGFVYARSPRGFDHLLQVTVLDGQRRVRRQIYGDALTVQQVVEPLKAILYERPLADGNPVLALAERVRLFCTTFDPASGSYRFDYSLFVGLVITTLLLAATLWFLLRELMRSRARGT